jgi:hypothetical protein
MSLAEAKTANDYVRALDLPAAPVTRARRGAPPQYSESQQAVAVGETLTEFSENVPPDVRGPIADSMLLAQLAATRAASQADDVFGWYEKYTEVLQHIGWQIRDLDFQTQEVTNEDESVHQAIIPAITAMLGPATAAASMVVSVLNGLQAMDKDAPWITLFDEKSQHAHGAKFQVSYVDADADGDPEISLLCFGVDATEKITQVLFFKFSAQSAALKKAAVKLAIDMDRLDAAKEAIAEKVGNFVSDYVKDIRI